MPNVVGDIAVKVGADITNLTVGLNQASGKVKGFGKDADGLGASMAAMATKATTAFGLIAAGAAAVGAAAQHVIQFSREIEQLSGVAGVGIERFQALGYAANQYGINQEKLADILKDTNDKFGDFMQTGAGPLADFFEQIAPKIGVTVDQFKRLNSADALQLYVSSLEKAGVNQKELTFYMEALASDATLLLPLLRDNAAEMGTLEQAAKDLGVVIDADLIQKSANMGRVWDTLLTQMHARFVSFAATVMDGFDAIFGITEEGQIQVGLRKLDALVDDRNATLDKIQSAKERGQRAVAAGGPDTTTEVALLQASLQAIEDEMNIENDALLKLNEVIRKREEAKARIAALSVGGDSGGTGDGTKPTSGKTGPTDAELESLQRALATQREIIQMDYDEQLTQLDAFLAAKKISEDEYRSLKEQAEMAHTQKLAQLRQQEQSRSLSVASDFFGAMAALAQAGGEKTFKTAKAFAIAGAIVDSYRAYTQVLADPFFIGRPFMRTIAAASVLASGLAQVASMRATTAGGSSAAALPSAAASGSAATPQGVANYTITGDVIGKQSGEELIRSINDAIKSGYQINLEWA